MGFPVIKGGGPVLLDRCVCRYMKSVCSGAFEVVAVLVLDRHQIELSLSKMPGTKECVRKAKPSRICRIDIGIIEVSGNRRYKLPRGRLCPSRTWIERRQKYILILFLKVSMRFGCRILQNSSCFCIRCKRPALLNADCLELIDHELVPSQPRLGLNHSVQRLEEPQVIRDRGVEDYIDCINECCPWRIRCF